MGPPQHSTGRNPAQRARQLQRRHLDRALPDADGDCLARVPLVVLRLQLPFGAGHDPGGFVRKVNARLHTDAYLVAIVRHGVDAQAVRQRVKERIARVGNRGMDVHAAMVPVTGKEVSVETCPAIALHVHALRHTLLQSCQRHDDFERRPRRQLRLDGLVQQRMVGVIEDGLPVSPGQPHGKLIWIERRPRHHRQDFAGMGIQRHHRADLAFHRLLRRPLDVQIDRQPQVLPRLRILLAHHADLAPVRVHNHVPRSILPPQNLVVSLLHAALADHIARLIERKFGVVQIRLGHLTHIAQHVRRKAVARVQPTLLVQRIELRQLIPVRCQKGLLIRRDVLLQRNGLILGCKLKVLQNGADLLRLHVQSLCNQRHVLLYGAHLLAQQVAGDRRVVVDNDPAFPVQDASPRGQHRHLAHPVLLRQHTVLRRPEHLQPPKPDPQHQQNQCHDILQSRQLPRRDLLFSS